MALETLRKGNAVYSSKMAEGESVEGYLLGFKEGKFGKIIVLQSKAGSQIEVYASGKLNFLQADLGEQLKTGAFMVITRVGNYTTKSGRTSGRFDVKQDRDDTIDAPALISETAATTATPKTSVEARLANLKKQQTA